MPQERKVTVRIYFNLTRGCHLYFRLGENLPLTAAGVGNCKNYREYFSLNPTSQYGAIFHLQILSKSRDLDSLLSVSDTNAPRLGKNLI